MRKITLLLAMVIAVSAHAQFGYDFSVSKQKYQPLTSGISLNGTTVWDDDQYLAPIGFNFDFMGEVMDTFYFSDCTAVITDIDMNANANVFFITDLDLHDRGNVLGNGSVSPVRYELVGTAPNRIFKCEVYNAGIYDEYDLFGTGNDSLSFQLWFYETSNVIELRYGPSQISNPLNYFQLFGQPIISIIKNIDLSSSTFDMFYYLRGDEANPVVDSVNDLNNLSAALNNYPSDSTVYRFTPKPVSVSNVGAAVAADISLLSNHVHDALRVKNNSKEKAVYRIVSVNGKAMNISGEMEKGTHSVDVSSLASGMYVLYVQQEKGAKAFRFVKY